MVKVPPEALSADALRGVIEAFVLREGTDYGHRDFSLEEKCRAVARQIAAGRVLSHCLQLAPANSVIKMDSTALRM